MVCFDMKDLFENIFPNFIPGFDMKISTKLFAVKSLKFPVIK